MDISTVNHGDEQCVGCDASTKGTYRPDANWHLCDGCYEDRLADEREGNLSQPCYSCQPGNVPGFQELQAQN